MRVGAIGGVGKGWRIAADTLAFATGREGLGGGWHAIGVWFERFPVSTLGDGRALNRLSAHRWLSARSRRMNCTKRKSRRALLGKASSFLFSSLVS